MKGGGGGGGGAGGNSPCYSMNFCYRITYMAMT